MARQISRAAEAAALRDGAKEPAASIEAFRAIREAMVGNAAQSRQRARAALVLARDYKTRFETAIALAHAGDSRAARQLVDLVNKERPFDTLVQNYWLPAVRAQIELNDGHAQRALELVEPTKPYELAGDVDVPMFPVYVRGRSYLASGNATAAALEFQKILDHRGLVGNDVTGALAHLYLGRARALEARSLQGAAADNANSQARAAYQDFLNLWKDADSDIPILRDAKSEYMKLQ